MRAQTGPRYSWLEAKRLRERWSGQEERIHTIIRAIQSKEDWTRYLLKSDEYGWDELPLLNTCPERFRDRLHRTPRDLRGLAFARLALSHTEGLADSCLDLCTFRAVSLDDASLTGASLRYASFVESDCSLDRAALEHADLQNADLTGVSLEDADLKGANLCGTNLEQAVLLGANLQGAKYSEEPTLGFLVYLKAFVLHKLRQRRRSRGLGFENSPIRLPWTRFGGNQQVSSLLDSRTFSSLIDYIDGENLRWSFWTQHPRWGLVWYLLANFGRSWKRLVLWILLVWLFFGILYAGYLPLLFGETRLGSSLSWIHPQVEWTPALTRWDSRPFYASAATMLSLGFEDVAMELKDWKAQVAVCTEALSGYVLLAMFITVLFRQSGVSIEASPSNTQRGPLWPAFEERVSDELGTAVPVERAGVPYDSGWYDVWEELRANAARQRRVQTITRKVANEIIVVDERGISVRSRQTGRERFVPAAQFEILWHHLTVKGRVLLSEIPKVEHGSVVLAIFVSCLPERVSVVGRNMIQVRR